MKKVIGEEEASKNMIKFNRSKYTQIYLTIYVKISKQDLRLAGASPQNLVPGCVVGVGCVHVYVSLSVCLAGLLVWLV